MRQVKTSDLNTVSLRAADFFLLHLSNALNDITRMRLILVIIILSSGLESRGIFTDVDNKKLHDAVSPNEDWIQNAKNNINDVLKMEKFHLGSKHKVEPHKTLNKTNADHASKDANDHTVIPGVNITKDGFWHKGFYYKRLCSKTQLYKLLHDCQEHNGGIDSCLPRLQNNKLIGKREMYLLPDGHHGIGIKFDQNWMIYGDTYYDILDQKSQIEKHFKGCINEYGDVNICLHKLHQKKLISDPKGIRGDQLITEEKNSTAFVQNSHPNALPLLTSVKFANGKFLYKNQAYRLLCTQKNFLLLWFRCILHYKKTAECFGRLLTLQIIEPYVKGAMPHRSDKNDHLARKLVYSLDKDYIDLLKTTKVLYGK